MWREIQTRAVAHAYPPYLAMNSTNKSDPAPALEHVGTVVPESHVNHQKGAVWAIILSTATLVSTFSDAKNLLYTKRVCAFAHTGIH